LLIQPECPHIWNLVRGILAYVQRMRRSQFRRMVESLSVLESMVVIRPFLTQLPDYGTVIDLSNIDIADTDDTIRLR